MSDRELDAEFARIVAGWDDEAPDPQPRPYAAEPLADEPPATPGPGADAPVDAASPAGSDTDVPAPGAGHDEVEPTATASARPAAGVDPATPPGTSGDVIEIPIAPTTPHVWRGSGPRRDDADELLDAVDPDDDHFVPPSEIDLPSAETDPMFWAIVAGLAGGPLLLLYVLLFDRDGSGWWIVTALSMVVVGFVLLVLRGGTERDPFDDGTRV